MQTSTPTVHTSPAIRKHPLNMKTLCAHLNKTKIRQEFVAQAALPGMLLGFSFVTLQQIVSGFILDLSTQLPGLLQVFQNKDIGGKVDHVLLPTVSGTADVPHPAGFTGIVTIDKVL